ncbi:hypothetical protein OQJ13_14525 [Legionella sp. PATHC035]|uniref:hypothetical protein n=1 Tax=Legionella sp. PATHC035 TaxID=2992040 RepID=UPI002244498E|nr:hypothetical protein [Legionella sp. PATHC035]MCW8410192.1 hypothetical protein [Legionella sp. PATHC035]
MTKSVVFSVDDDEKRQKILAYYRQFMNQQNAEDQSYTSLAEFKNSQHYQDLSEEEKENLEQYEGKDVIVLVFETPEQAIEFIRQIQKKGLISAEQAEELTTSLQELEPYRPGM